MTYDSWKAHNPADELLGPDPSRCPVCGCEISADETPCDLEYGSKCGIALLQEEARR